MRGNRVAAVAVGSLLGAVALAACSPGGDVGEAPPERAEGLAEAAVERLDRSPVARSTDRAGGAARESGGAAPLAPSVRPVAGSDAWKIERPALDGQVEGYATRSSGHPGVPLVLKVSSTADRWRAAAYRIGDHRGGTGHEVWRSDWQRGVRQPGARVVDAATRTVEAPWRPSLEVRTDRWQPGFYVVRLWTGAGWENQVPYVVSSPDPRGTVALVAPVTTWQAYNLWGGSSLYGGPAGQAYAVSFDRPYAGVGGFNNYRTGVVPIVVRAEASGVPLSYYASTDLHAHPRLLDGAAGYVSMGHDEYWTPSMRDTVERARDAGTNLAFLGANTMYWRVRLEPRHGVPARLMTGYRHAAGLDPETRPRHVTARFRDAPAPDPEDAVTGMLYECYPVDTDYVVHSPGWWGFRGTGVRAGTRVPDLVGGESDRVYPGPSMPDGLQVLSHTTFPCRGTTTSTQSTYYTAPSGAGVFTAGTLRWGCALRNVCDRPLPASTVEFTRTVTTTLLRGYAAGPVGQRHPSRPNVAALDLPRVNLVGAS